MPSAVSWHLVVTAMLLLYRLGVDKLHGCILSIMLSYLWTNDAAMTRSPQTC